MDLIFEWDPEKDKANQRKHKVSFDEARTVFADFLAITHVDETHSAGAETRLFTAGTSRRNRILLVVHCERADRIRIISARVATAWERKIYEEENRRRR